eukprot:TRINITY_DN22482_c0_g1_i1.p1 TRINITY_DN22482_c0_g1~~TRINITY_DN22482_c0_g1_i1.p1  ORF type:complete len:931 (+),score=109.12 TRINITY_DN22482_c0_g1_i1:118-2910(+)
MTLVLGHRTLPNLENQGQAQQPAQRDVKSLVLSCNKDAMECLQKGQLKASFEQLKYAEALLIASQPEGESTSLLAVTCNNLGTYYKKTGKLHGALSYLRRALKIEEDLRADPVTIAGTHLEISAVLSKLEKHDKALDHGLCALALAENHIEPASQEDSSVLVLAYHSVAAEHECLRDTEKAVAAYRKGHEVAQRCLGENHPLSVTLGKNCEESLKKLTKPKHLSSSHTAFAKVYDPFASKSEQEGRTVLPPIAAAPSFAANESDGMLPREGGLRREAANWLETETSAWDGFAQRTLGAADSQMNPVRTDLRPAYVPQAPAAPPLQPNLQTTLRSPALPTTQAPGRPQIASTDTSRPFLGRTALDKALDDHPEVLKDIIYSDAEVRTATGAHVAPLDCRPHRLVHGATRTKRIVERTCTRTTTKHRDMLISGQASTLADVQLAYRRKAAAERIQRMWRAWYKYCQENHDWMTATHIAATIIQSRWRSYHIRRDKKNRSATCIQRHMRGCLVRSALKRHRAAVAIQRHIAGVLTRMQMLRMRIAATKIQSLARGAAARRRVKARRQRWNATCTAIQCAFRQRLARRRVGQRRAFKQEKDARRRGATDIQRVFRGYKGRLRAEHVSRVRERERLECYAATKLQAMAKRHFAIKIVDRVRERRRRDMNDGATRIAKMWKGFKARRHYQNLRREFKMHEGRVVTMQRYTRGCLVRMRMWRAAVSAERELWAASEIQRVWRGYLGRIRWEAMYEQVYTREMAARVLQRNIRGWLARCRVARVRRKMARREFEMARQRFRSAQRIQALVRGVLCRKETDARRALRIRSVVHIQRHFRGHRVRKVLWRQVTEIRAIMIQAAIRGFLTRNRRFHMIAVVISIQRAWRNWRQKPEIMRRRAMNQRQARKESAAIIQRQVRRQTEEKELTRLRGDEIAEAS